MMIGAVPTVSPASAFTASTVPEIGARNCVLFNARWAFSRL
ncbi:hypothetical protein [Candidatus Amarolinea dominans]